jgi:catechol 2,3-dioxygenase
MQPLEPAADPARGLAVGHVHLRVADLDRAIAFYRDAIGLDLQARFASGAAFLGADGYHHHVALNTWGSAGGTPPPPGHAGLFHVAFLYPDRPALARAAARVIAAGVAIEGKADHGVSEAVYLSDPDGNGIELYRDRPRAEWPTDAEGRLVMTNDPLDLDALLAEAELPGRR